MMTWRPGKPRRWRPRWPRTRTQARAGELIAVVLSRYGVTREVREHRLVAEWPEIVGARVASRAWPERLSGGVLWVRVSNSAWLQELSFLRAELVARINAALGEPALLGEIKLQARRAGPAPDDLPSVPRRRPPPVRRPLPPPATGAELRRIEREAEAVEDPELRAAILRARRRLNL